MFCNYSICKQRKLQAAQTISFEEIRDKQKQCESNVGKLTGERKDGRLNDQRQNQSDSKASESSVKQTNKMEKCNALKNDLQVSKLHGN